MPRKTRPLDRESGVVRDASLVIIASEDTYAVQQFPVALKCPEIRGCDDGAFANVGHVSHVGLELPNERVTSVFSGFPPLFVQLPVAAFVTHCLF